MKQSKEDTATSSAAGDQNVDLISAVRELNGLASQDLNKLLKDSENFTVQCKTEKGLLRQIDVEKLASSLPLHLMAILLSPDRNIRMAHLLRGLRLLHTLSDLATRHARLEQILLDDVKFSEKVLDLVFFTSIVLARRKQDNHLGATPVLHCAIMASSLHLLTSFISSQWHDLVHVLLAHPKVDVFMDVAFDAVCEGIRILDITLQTLNNDVLCTKASLSSAERTVNYICQQCESSLQFLLSLCQQKFFRDRVLRNKELCKQGGILRLAYVILKLNVPHCFKESSDVLPAISRLKAKVLSILLQLCEAENISYLDEVAGSPKGMYLAKSVALQFLELLKCAYKREVKQPGDSHFRSHPTGHVLLNAFHLADIFSDDSNFRSFFITTTIPVLVELFAVPDDEFKSNWCSLRLSMTEEDGNLEYDPFAAAGTALLSLSEDNESAQTTPFLLTGANSSCSLNLNVVPSSTYAQQRTSYLVKIIANLHVFVPNMCKEEERDLFLNKFFEHLRAEFIESTQSTSSFGTQKAATICRNLSSLSQFATSLTTIFDDEDVHLVSVFADKLQKLTCVQVGEDPVQENTVKNEMQHIKSEDVCHLQQSSMNWTNVSSSNFGRSHQDTKDFIGSSPSVVRALDGSFEEDALKLRCNDVDPKMEDEKTENGQGEEKQPKKRKRNIMSENQIFVIETALQDEPEMQRNAVLLQSWADKLSSQGPEITSSQLKNWLNNRKARLARAAKEVRASSEGDTSYPDKPSGPGISNMYDSPESAGEELYVTPARGGGHQPLLRSPSILTRAMSIDNAETNTQSEFVHGSQPNRSSGRTTSLEPGLDVSLVDAEGKLVGTGKIFQVEGRWQGRTLNSGICIIDIIELKVERRTEVQHPSEAAGKTFEEAVARNEGVMRVAWDTARIFQLH